MSFAVFSLALGLASLRRATWASVAFYLGSVLALAVAIVLAMGQPRPRWTFLQPPRNAMLLASRLQEPLAIYLWLLPDGASVPVAVELPWSEGAAAQAQMATQAAQRNHGSVSVQMIRGQPRFYASTIKAPPPKAGER